MRVRRVRRRAESGQREGDGRAPAGRLYFPPPLHGQRHRIHDLDPVDDGAGVNGTGPRSVWLKSMEQTRPGCLLLFLPTGGRGRREDLQDV
eukprot:gene18403-biopygen881